MSITSEPCLYFVRGHQNSRATNWVKIEHVYQDHRITDHELYAILSPLQYVEMAPSYWQNNNSYQLANVGAGTHTPRQTYAIVKLPVKLVMGLTADQAEQLVSQIDPYVMKNLAWNSTHLHSIATINHLPTTAKSAHGFYRKGDIFFHELERMMKLNVPQSTLGHKHGLAKQIAQLSPTPAMAAVTAPKPKTPVSAPVAAPAVSATAPPPRPRGVHNLHRRLGLKGGHPDPTAIKALKRIWNNQSGSTPETVPAPAPTSDKPEIS